MERLTTNKSVTDMTILELMHNNCYADNDRNARYRDYEMEMDARDFARNLMATLTKDELPLDDAEFDEEIFDNLTIDPFSDVRGLIILFYLNLCTKAELYEKLKKYEDAEEQELLLRLPCKVGDTGMTEKIKVESLEIIAETVEDKLYYEIQYKEVGKNYYNIGYSSCNPENVLKWKDECFELVDEQLAECPEELKQYRAIGTVEECRAAEKQKAKMIEVRKAKNEDIESELRDFITPKGKIVRCPTCRSCLAFEMKFCFECGQKLDWGDEE